MIHAYVSSRLDQHNELLVGLPDYQYRKLRRIQYAAARILLRTKFEGHMSPVLRKLHWLPAELRIDFKILLTVYKCLNGLAPSYLTELVQVKSSDKDLRSNDTLELKYPKLDQKFTTATYGDRAFSVVSRKLWKSIPFTIRNCETVSQFKSALKTHLFRKWLK